MSDDIVIPNGLTNYPTVPDGSALIINSITIESGATLIAEGTSTVTGNITYNRNLVTENWYLVSAPVVGETYDDDYVSANSIASGPLGRRAIAPYKTENDSWLHFQAGGVSTLFTSGKGYSVKRSNGAEPGNISFTGTLKVDDTTIALTTTGNGYNLIGNPYPSYINSASLLTTNTGLLDTQTIWVWNQNTSNYDTKITTNDFKIAPGQGFFVQSNGTSGDLSIPKSKQSHNTTDTFQKSNSNPEIRLNFTDGENNRTAKIYYIDGTTTGFDNGHDGKLFGGVPHPFAIYSYLIADELNYVDGIKYAIQSLPNSDYENMIIPIGINTDANKDITFNAEALNLPSGMKVYLADIENNTYTRLDEVDSN